MRLWKSSLALFLALSPSLVALDPQLELVLRYNSVHHKLLLLPSKYDINSKIYSRDNIENTFTRPSYNASARDYEYPVGHVAVIAPDVLEVYMPELEAVANLGHIPAMVELADILMFGHHSVPINYAKALGLYRKAAESGAEGHANFMLGLVYSTGWYGLVPKNEQMALFHYTIAAENGDSDAMLALAHRYLMGLGVVKDCPMAHAYYSRIVEEKWPMVKATDPYSRSYSNEMNVNIADFEGGLLGRMLSESSKSYFIAADSFASQMIQYNEAIDDPNVSYLAEKYLDALLDLQGDFLEHSNYSKALQEFENCIKFNTTLWPESRDQLRYIHNNCKYYLGIMYFRGLGVEKDLQKAVEIFELSDKLKRRAAVELAQVYELGLLGRPVDLDKAISLYNTTSTFKGVLNVHRLLKNKGQTERANLLMEKILLSSKKNYYSSPEALYELAKYLERKNSNETPTSLCQTLVTHYNGIVHLESGTYVPSFEYAMNELVLGNFQNALLGFVIAAELGLEKGAVSAAHLLIPRRSLYSSWFASNKSLSESKPDPFVKQRVLSGIEYLKAASSGNDIDATVYLGNLYYDGYDLADIPVDHHKAYNYYTKASRLGSANAYFNLGYMYEYGHGPANNSVDYSMAKSNYDKSLELKFRNKGSTVPVSIALVRVRIKNFFSRKPNLETSSWWGALFYEPKNFQAENTETPQEAAQELQNVANEAEEQELMDWFTVAMILLVIGAFSLQLLLGRNNINRAQGNNNNEARRNWEFQVHFVAL